MEAVDNPIFTELGVRFITNEKGEKEEIVFNFRKFLELWEDIEETLLVDEKYEDSEDAKIAHIVLERTKRVETGQSRGHTQEEVEKMFGVS